MIRISPDVTGLPDIDEEISRIVTAALREDTGPGDLTTALAVTADEAGDAAVVCGAPGVLAGADIARRVFHAVDPGLNVAVVVNDGSGISPGDVALTVGGKGAAILKAERTALNFIQRMSGIATLTAKFVVLTGGTRAKITDTRKTAPGLRLTDKLAVRSGGGVNHRFGLYDMVLIKDNHIAAAGGITEAVARCMEGLRMRGLSVPVEVETKDLDEVREALSCTGVDRIMLDNFTPDGMRRAVELIDRAVEVEASGNVSLATVAEIARTGVDFISVGALTHSAAALDFSLDYRARHSRRPA